MRLADAKAALAPYGLSIRRTGYGREVRVFPKGSRDPDVGYFTDDIDDAVATGIADARRENPGALGTILIAAGALAAGALGYYLWQKTATSTITVTPALPAGTTAAATPTAAVAAQLSALGLPQAGTSATAGGYTITTSADGTTVKFSNGTLAVVVNTSDLQGSLLQGTLSGTGATGTPFNVGPVSASAINAAFAPNTASTWTGATPPPPGTTGTSPPVSQLLQQAGLPAAGQSKSYSGPGGSATLSTSSDGTTESITMNGSTTTVAVSSLTGSVAQGTLTSSDASVAAVLTALNNAVRGAV